MLTFLRRIRKSLIDSGSARKYLLYAIGEIALVVIGILIALQINNWNEGRKDKRDARAYSADLIEEIILDTLKVSQMLNDRKERITIFENYVDLIKEGGIDANSLYDSLDKINIYYDYSPFNFTTFEDLKSTGNLSLFDIETRADISAYYQFSGSYQEIINRCNRRLEQESLEASKFFSKQVDVLKAINHSIPEERYVQGLIHSHNRVIIQWEQANMDEVLGPLIIDSGRKLISTLSEL